MPKKVKKGGGGGGGAEEGRLSYLQQRAQAEEEASRQKEAVLTLFLKDKLQKEERNAAVNRLKVEDGWRSILRGARADELRDDITVLNQTFERQLDGLDSIIQTQACDLQEAERQEAQAWRTHLQHAERLWAQQDRRLASVQQQWEDGVQQLAATFGSKRTQMLAGARQQRADLQDAASTLKQQHGAETDATVRLYSDIITAHETAHQDRMLKLICSTEERLQEAELQRQEAELQQQEEEELRREQTGGFKPLLHDKQLLLRRAGADVTKVKRLQHLVLQLRDQLSSRKVENQNAHQELTADRNQAARRRRQLQQQLTRSQAAAKKKLGDLVMNADGAAKDLKTIITKGEMVLRVMEICQKKENNLRNVYLLPLEPGPEEPGPEGAGPEGAGPEGAGPEGPAQEASDFPELQQLTARTSGAILQREALRRERARLSRENEQLKVLLRQHLDAMTLSDHALDGRRALLAVRPAPTATSPPDTARRHSVLEAVHAAGRSL